MKSMPKTRKRGGTTQVNYFADERISTDPNLSPAYKSCGILMATSIKGVNMVRTFGTNLLNQFGKSGFELSIYEELKQDAMNKLMEEMNKKGVERLSGFRIEYIESPHQLVANCYGTALQSTHLPRKQ
jgi:uncharacterized protein YbjQ (UPF0145 family)